VADYNGDGVSDVAISNFLGNQVSVLFGFTGGGVGGLTAAPGSPFGGAASPDGIASGDFNNDGHTDLAVASNTGTVVVFLNNGTGSFFDHTSFAVGVSPSRVAVADFDLDGNLDIVVSNFGSNNIGLLRGFGNGSFAPVEFISPGAGVNGLLGIAAADVNRDGRPDLAVVGHTSSNVAVLLNLPPSIQLQNNVLSLCGDQDNPNEDDTFRIVRNASNTGLVDIFINNNTAVPTFSVPLTFIKQINVFAAGGNDNLIVDSTNGLLNLGGGVLPNLGIRYDGDHGCPGQIGAGIGGFDRLTLQQVGGATQTSDTYSVGANPGDGTSVIVGASGTQTVFFQYLEPVLDNVPAATVIINATPADNAINYSQGPGGGIFVGNTGLVTIDEQESYEFNNKTNLVINALAGSDTINLNNATVPAGLTGTITVNGNDPTGSDTLIVNSKGRNLVLEPTAQGAGTVTYFGGGLPNTPFTGIEDLTLVDTSTNPFGIDGTAGNDQFIYTPGVTPDTGTVNGTMNSGVAQFPLVPVTFVGMQQAGVVVFNTFGQQGGTDSFVFNGTAANDNISVTNGGVFGGITLSDTINATLFANLNLNNMAGGLAVQGNDGDDVFTHAGNVPIPVTYNGGDPSASDTLNFNGNGAGAVTVDPLAQTVTETGFAAVTYSGVERINVNAGGNVMTVNGTAGDDAFNFVPATAGAGSFTTSATGAVTLTSPQFTYTNVTGNITINGLAGVDTLGLTATPGNDNINAVQGTATTLAYTQNAFTQNFTVNAMEAASIDAGAGDDVVRVSVADALEATPASSLHFLVNGGSGIDRLLVNDDGIGDLTVLRQIDGQSGNATVGVLNPITYSSAERIDVTPVNNLTGGTGTDGNGRVVAFHADPFEYNDTLFNASALTRVPAFPTSPSIDSAQITNPFAVGGDEDWYQFLPTQTGTFNVSIVFRAIGTLANGRAGLPGSGNLTLDIFDATGTLITSGVATVDASGVTHLSATFGATSDPASVFSDIYVRVRGATPNSVNVYEFDHLGTSANLQVDNEGPQVTNVFITDFPGYNLFGLKPVDALQGPTPLVNSLTIDFQDLPARAPGFVYPALDPITAGTPGMYVLRGDRVGIVSIQQIIVTNDPPVVGGVPTAHVQLIFAHPLPDDHYTLTVSDHILDPAGNRLDGESNAAEPNEGPTFPSGDGHPGGRFIAAFVVDSVPELGFYANGSANIDINGDFIVNPNVLPEGDVILPYGPNGAAVFSGQFSDVGAFAVNGFDRLGSYGKEAGLYGFRLDFNDDGDFNDPGEFIPSGLQLNGMPIAGHFSDVKAGDQVGLFTGTKWYFDTNGNNMIDAFDNPPLIGNMRGLPIAGDFDGDGFVDLGTYQNGTFFFDLAANGLSGNTDVSFRVAGLPGGVNGVASRLARPVAGDFNRDGITDVGLFIPNQTNLTRYQANWYFLVSNENLYGPRISGTVNNLNHPFRSNQLPGGSNDFSTAYGSSRALPIVGNFDPPRAVIAARNHGATTSATHLANLLLAHDLTDLYFATDIDPRTGMLRRHHN
jgi:hypothetical protein